MNEDRQNIGNIFKSTLENYNAQPEEGEWIMLDQKLTKVSFFRFSFSKFNIYYSILIVSTFIMSSTIFINSFINTENKSSLENSPVSIKENKIITSDSIKTIDPVASKENVITSNKEINKHDLNDESRGNKDGNKSGNSVKVELNDFQKSSSPQTKDSVLIRPSNKLTPSNSVEKETITTDPSNKIKSDKPKKVVYISKQDTIIVYDTLNRKKPFNKTRNRK